MSTTETAGPPTQTGQPATEKGGTDPRARTPPAELAARLAAVQAALTDRGWSALVVSDPANLHYLSGYDAWSFYTPQCLVVPVTGRPVLFARAMDAAGARHTCSLPAEDVHGYPESLVHRPDTHPYAWICTHTPS